MRNIKDQALEQGNSALKFVTSSVKKVYDSMVSSEKVKQGVDKTKEFY